MLPNIENYRVGNLLGRTYFYEKNGDELTGHTHPQKDEHITIVLSGGIKVIRDGVPEEYKAGSIVEFKEGEHHSIISTEDNTKTIHFYSYQDIWLKFMNENDNPTTNTNF
jgi:quercetin dioxygenase-like cupin family protein